MEKNNVKRGTRYTRGVLHIVAHNSVHPRCNGEIGNPVLEKLNSKPVNMALCAVTHKVVNIIFTVLHDQKPFDLRNPEMHARKLREHHLLTAVQYSPESGKLSPMAKGLPDFVFFLFKKIAQPIAFSWLVSNWSRISDKTGYQRFMETYL